MKSLLRILTAIQFLLLLPMGFYALEYTDVYSDVTEAFSFFVDPNEGLTSFRTLLIPSGGKAESMGNAFTGLADDVSYIEYNPAASSVIDATQIGLYHNAWIADTSLDTLSFTTRFNNLGIGASIKCLYLSFSEYNYFGENTSAGYYSETIGAFNVSYNFLAGYDFKGLAAGASFKTAYRGMPDYADNETDQVIPDSGLLQSGIAFMGDLGLQTRLNAFKFYSSREANMQIGLSAMNFGAGFTSLGSELGAVLDDPLPSKVSLGFSYKPVRPVILVLELSQPVNLQNIALSGRFSAGTGISVQATSFFAVHGGFFLSGGSPRFSLGSEFLLKNYLINVNYTLDFTSSLHPLNRISLSVKVDLGDKGRQETRDKVDELYAKGLQYYYNGDLNEAIVYWNDALALDPGFDPAKRGIESAELSLALQLRIIEIQRLE
ncbi:MAG TPA: UPF0164 family protein [Treponemataceae bacterium]|nr:UPF0164 family protein [Treponemataceae bacterium]